jgi:uncharacterized protein YbjQ (UPF0145 family)
MFQMIARSLLRTSSAVTLSTTEAITGFKIVKNLGVVSGSTVRTKNIVGDLISGFKSYVGGELEVYTHLLVESREEALDRLKDNAARSGGNAVVGVRIATSNIAPQASEVVAYGTAVVIEPLSV